MEAEQRATQTYWCDEEEWRTAGRGGRCEAPWGSLAGAGGKRPPPRWGQVGDGADEGLERARGAFLECCFYCCEKRKREMNEPKKMN